MRSQPTLSLALAIALTLTSAAAAAAVETAWDGISRGYFTLEEEPMIRTVEFEVPITSNTFAGGDGFYLVVDFSPAGDDDDDDEARLVARANRGTIKVTATLISAGAEVRTWRFKGRESGDGYSEAFKRVRGQRAAIGDVIAFQVRFKRVSLPAFAVYELLAGVVSPAVFEE